MISGNDGNNMVMPVAPYGGYGNGGCGFGGDWSSWIILFLIWGMFGNNGSWGNNGNQTPWLLAQNTNNGFDQAALSAKLEAIQGSVNTGAIESLKANYENQIASMNQRFNDYTSQNAQMNGIAASLQNCCCENRQSIANLKAELLATYSAGIQAIKDELCADRLEAAKRENDNLRTQLQMAQLAATQNEQTATIQAGQRSLANEIEQYVLPTPRPAYMVTNPNCCQQNYACGM